MLPSASEIEYFIEVCNVLNFSRASERLGISQPSLSMAIKKLENTLGTALFVRSKQGVMLTQAGKNLLLHASELLRYWEKTKTQALSSNEEVRGFFTLGCHTTIANYLAVKFLPDLLEKYPKLEIHLKHDLSRKINEQLVNLSIDIGIVVNPFQHPDLVIRELFQDEVTFWSAKKKNNLNEIHNKEAVVIADPDLIQTQSLLKVYKKQGISIHRMVTTASLEVAANLAIEGGGIAILPKRVALAFGKDKLQALPSAPIYHDQICLVYRHENRNIQAIQKIIDTIKQWSV